MTGIVLDCSVAMAWFLNDQSGEYAERVLQSLEWTNAVVPAIWRLEVLNVLTLSERRGRVTRGQSLEALSHLRSLPIQIESPDESSSPEVLLKLSGDLNLTAYDAAYLDTALRRELPLATMDDALRRACEASGARLFQP